MALIISCEGPCNKRMGYLDEFRIKDNKYMCLECAGEAKPKSSTIIKTQTNCYTSLFEPHLKRAYSLLSEPNRNYLFELANIPEANTILNRKVTELYFVVNGPQESINNCNDQKGRDQMNYNSVAFDLILYKQQRIKIVTIKGFIEKSNSSPHSSCYFAKSLWEQIKDSV